MIFITGDTHMPIDISKLNTKNFPIQKIMTKNDYVIICGDFGGVWDGSNEEKYWIKWLTNKSFTTLFIDGNHENFDMLNQYPIEEWNGGKVHKINESIIHLTRGQVFTINGLSFFTMGGGQSTDKHCRIEGKTWWPQEIPSKEEFEEGVVNLEKINWKVDYVLTHSTTTDNIKTLAIGHKRDELDAYLDFVEKHIEYKHWYFGHFHGDKRVKENQTLVYDKIHQIQ